jgi:hypothetical protein
MHIIDVIVLIVVILLIGLGGDLVMKGKMIRAGPSSFFAAQLHRLILQTI